MEGTGLDHAVAWPLSYPHALEDFGALANLVRDVGEHEDALLLYELAAKDWELNEPEHPLYATTLKDWAALLQEMGRDNEAEEVARRLAMVRTQVRTVVDTSP